MQYRQGKTLHWLAACALLLGATGVLAQTASSTITRTSSFEYDVNGMLEKEVIEPDDAEFCLQTTHSYNAQGNRTGTTSATCAGATSPATDSALTPRSSSSVYAAQTVSVNGVSYTSPAGVFATQSTNAKGHSETREFDPRFGGITKLVGPNGGITTWAYDSFGRKARENRADGTYTVWGYNLCVVNGVSSCPATIGNHAIEWYATEASYGTDNVLTSAVKYQFYDTLGRVVRTQTQSFDGQTVAQETHFDALGRATQKSIPFAALGGDPKWTTYEYDDIGRVVKETTPTGGTTTGITQFTYNGLTTTVTNARNQNKTTLKNAMGQVAQVIDNLSGSVTYTYDALGQLTQTNAAGSVTKLTYNQRGQKKHMEDPGMGVWDYQYNAYGELVSQTDSLSQVTKIDYDLLGRMTARTEPDLTSNWYYDAKADDSACPGGIGKLCEATANNGYRRLHSYDAMGRPTQTATALDSATNLATVSQAYSPVNGRVISKTWPTGFVASYEYTAASATRAPGYLFRVQGKDAGVLKASLQVESMNPQGSITSYLQGNNVITVKNIDEATGRINSIQATRDSNNAGDVFNHTYTYDKLGNLLTRSDANTSVAESFAYDSLNRINLYTALGGGLNTTQQTQVLYDAVGNIKYKSDVGYYHYDAARPQRLTNITLTQESGWSAMGAVSVANSGTKALAYAFDDLAAGNRSMLGADGNATPMGNGNLMYTVSQDGSAGGSHTVRWESYTSFNMPLEMKFGALITPANPTATTADRTLSFVYGPEHQRIRQNVALTSNAPTSMEAGTTWYLNGEDSQGLSYEKEIKGNGITEHKHYISAGGMSFALYTQRTGANLNGKPAKQTSYFHNDHLGSMAALSNEAGVVIERLAYDPWGKRRNVNGLSDPHDTLAGVNTDRGYTMHEHLDEMGVIHMNGRVYDPAIGRFMSADPIIQAPSDLQSYNRYAYVRNNPLNKTDPSGFSWWTKFRRAIVQVVAAVADAYGCSGYCSAAVGAYYGKKDGGDKGMIVGAIAGFVAGSNGGGGGLTTKSVAVAAASGCATASASGGNCGRGAGSALIGLLGGQGGMIGSIAGGCVAASNSGGNCRDGALNAGVGIATRYLIEGGIDSAQRMSNKVSSASPYRRGELLLAGGPDMDFEMIGNFIRDEGWNVLSRTATALGGAGQIGLGATICVGAVTCVGGAALAANGVSNMQEGLSGSNGFVRDFAVKNLGGPVGNLSVDLANLATSGMAFARPVLQPVGGFKLFNSGMQDYVPAIDTMSRGAIVLEGVPAMIGVGDAAMRK